MSEEIMVSIDCLSFNHENYISDALESFLMQKTDFLFEILIHDDASTDRTAQIIKEYEKKYPEIIKPVYQIENQYSQGVKVSLMNHNRASGKYIAVCEGDDYWTDPYKLQKQVDYMELHPECSMCVHGAYNVSPDKERKLSKVMPSQKNRIFTIVEVIEGGGGLFATNSIVYSKEKFLEFPFFCPEATVGDYPLVIYGALKGKLYYIKEPMSAYRTGVNGSWTEREFKTMNKRLSHYGEIERMLEEINHYTHFQYDSTIKKVRKRNKFYLLIEQKKFKEIKMKEYWKLYLEQEFFKRIVSKVKSLIFHPTDFFKVFKVN